MYSSTAHQAFFDIHLNTDDLEHEMSAMVIFGVSGGWANVRSRNADAKVTRLSNAGQIYCTRYSLASR